MAGASLETHLAPVGECVEWIGGRFLSGYGRIWHEGKLWRAHRLAWATAYGPIPDGLHVLHSCDNKPCCNLAHLRLGTHAENMADARARKRQAKARRNHCVHGHEYTPENLIVRKDGARTCRRCNLESVRRYQARINTILAKKHPA